MNTELAWAAGFFDGEGCSGIAWHKNENRYRMRIMLSQSSSPETLQRFQRAVGGLGKISGPYTKRHFNNLIKQPKVQLPVWKLNIYRTEDIKFVSAMLMPLLCTAKREQMHRMLNGIRNDGRCTPIIRSNEVGAK